ncbi:amidase domain-containing protein [Subtercola sp. YIM 133946]|uniref:amidase domain-containing protein n=1 Tax=Subtercola sp. YIM 133946 TaxID=3118909 RepID=UPI002F93F8C4
MIATRRAFLALAAGSGLMALAGCAALSAQGESQTTPTPTIAAGPQVTAASIAIGSLMGGTEVRLTGTMLADTVAVTIGANPATSVALVDDTTIGFVTPPAVDYQPANAPITLTQSDGTTIDTGRQFSYQAVTPVDRQLQYAFTYWQNYNLAEWGIFSDNDCGNFVNQTLVARGWAQNADWYSDYVSSGDYSYSWIRGTEMDDYLASRPDTTRYELNDRGSVKIGDVVMFDWDPQNDNGPDHTMIVSKVVPNSDGTIAIKLAGHTVDAQYRDLDTAITVDNPGGTAHFYSIA